VASGSALKGKYAMYRGFSLPVRGFNDISFKVIGFADQ
jgi:hypothetical protein